MAIVKLNLKDLGGVPLVYDTGLVEIEQDPAWVVANAPGYLPNVYGPADVFRAPDGRTVDYHEALAMALSQVDLQRSVNQAPPTGATANTPGAQSTASGAKTPAESAASATGTTLDELMKFLKRPIWPDDPHSVSTGIVLGGIVLVWYLMSDRKRK
jgi:hypothetical protein